MGYSKYGPASVCTAMTLGAPQLKPRWCFKYTNMRFYYCKVAAVWPYQPNHDAYMPSALLIAAGWSHGHWVVLGVSRATFRRSGTHDLYPDTWRVQSSTST